MKYYITILTFLISHICYSQNFINRSGAANTVIDQRLGAAQNFFLPRLIDTTLSGGLDSIGNLIYDRLRAKIAIRDTVLTGGHKFTFLFKTDDTVSTLATKYDLTQIPTQNISNAALTANGNYSQNWSENQWYVDSIAGSFLFRMGGIGNTGTRRKEFRINWGGSSFGDNLDGFNMLASVKKADLSGDSLTMGLQSSGTGVLSMGTYDIASSSNNNFISYSATSGLININAKDSIWMKGAVPAATADSILGMVFRSANGASKIVKIPISAAVGSPENIDSTLKVGNVDTATTLRFGYQDMPNGGFVQAQENSPSDTSWIGEPMLLYPYRSSDTAVYQPNLFRLFRVQTHRYDVTQPANVIMSTFQFGREAIGQPYVRFGAVEQNWYNNYELHFLEFKLLGDAAAKRIGSATMNRTTGVGTITWRMGQQIFSDLSDNQMLALNNGNSTLRASNVLSPSVNLDLQSTDGTNAGLRISIPSLGQTLYNWHPASGSFHVDLWDLPYQLIMGTSRTVNSSDAEYDIRFASRLKNNRFLTYKNASSFLMVMEVDSDSLNSVTVGGDHSIQNGSFSLMAKSLRNKKQKQFAIAIASNAADTFYYKVPFATDTAGRIAVNVPNPNEAVKDGALGLTETEDFRVYGKSIIVDNTAGLNRLLTLKNTDGGNFSGASIKFFNNVGTGSTNGVSQDFYSNGTSAPYTNAFIQRNYEGGPFVWFGQSAELGRFNDNGHFLLGSTTDGSETLQVTGSVAFDLGSDATGDIFYRNSGGSFTRLGIGSTNQVLTVIGGLPSWQTESISTTTSSAGTLTLSNSGAYIFNGTTTTWTLPAVSGTTGTIYYIKNIGSGSITLNADSGSNEIYTSSAVNTTTITAGSAIILISNGTYWTVN